MSDKIIITHKNQKRNGSTKKQRSRAGKKQSSQNQKNRKTFSRGANQPIARTNRYRNRGARYQAGPNGTLTVKHTEYITDILSDVSNDWELSTYLLNPGDVTVFPWLNKLATNYEKYVVDSFVVHYEPVCSTTVNGGFSMLIDYDASDTNVPSKQVFFNSQNATTAPYHAESKLTSTRNQLNSFFKEKSVRTVSSDPSNRREYDFGRLMIARDPTPGISAGTQLGRLFFTYTFTFKIPALQDPTEIVLPNGYPQVGYFETSGGLQSTSVTNIVTVDGPHLISTNSENEYVVASQAIPDGSTLMMTFSTVEIPHLELQDTPYIRIFINNPSNAFSFGAGVKDTQLYDAFSVSLLWKINKALPNWQLMLVDFFIKGASVAGWGGNFTCQLLPVGAFDRRDEFFWNIASLTSMVLILPLSTFEEQPSTISISNPPRRREESSPIIPNNLADKNTTNDPIRLSRRSSLTL